MSELRDLYNVIGQGQSVGFFLDFGFFLQYNIRRSYFYEWGFRPQRHSFYVPGYVEFIAEIPENIESGNFRWYTKFKQFRVYDDFVLLRFIVQEQSFYLHKFNIILIVQVGVGCRSLRFIKYSFEWIFCYRQTYKILIICLPV